MHQACILQRLKDSHHKIGCLFFKFGLAKMVKMINLAQKLTGKLSIDAAVILIKSKLL